MHTVIDHEERGSDGARNAARDVRVTCTSRLETGNVDDEKKKKVFDRCTKEEKTLTPDIQPCATRSGWEDTPDGYGVFALRDSRGAHIADYTVRGFVRIRVFRRGPRDSHARVFAAEIGYFGQYGSDTVCRALAGLAHVPGREDLEGVLLYLLSNDAPDRIIVTVATQLHASAFSAALSVKGAA